RFLNNRRIASVCNGRNASLCILLNKNYLGIIIRQHQLFWDCNKRKVLICADCKLIIAGCGADLMGIVYRA
ncbi:hypothetical protein AAC610_15520, partial [Neisseria gonorrhoeae]